MSNMSLIRILLATLILGMLLTACSKEADISEGPATEPVKLPNILLAISDDQSYLHVGAYGHTTVRTPTFDRLAEQGVLFNNAFTASAMCTVARASLFTGRNPWQNGEAGQHGSHFPAALVSYVDLLEEAGYAVGYTGKSWSPGNWEITGWERNPGGPAFNDIKVDPLPLTGLFDSDYTRNFKAFLEQKDPDQPFAFVYGAKEPHGPYEKGSGLRAGLYHRWSGADPQLHRHFREIQGTHAGLFHRDRMV